MYLIPVDYFFEIARLVVAELFIPVMLLNKNLNNVAFVNRLIDLILPIYVNI